MPQNKMQVPDDESLLQPSDHSNQDDDPEDFNAALKKEMEAVQ